MSEFARALVRYLVRFGNVVLEGPPGTGKTYAVSEVAAVWKDVTGRDLGGSGDGEFAITMHPSTAYEDFVEGLRYNDQTGKFHQRDGFIRRVVERAKKNPDQDYLVLLDELNRSNVPKVLGDLLLTMERTKRSTWDSVSSKWSGGTSVTLPYSQATFTMPSNIYVLATMNTSDRSIAPLDVALRRRFAFVRAAPVMGDDLKQLMATVCGRGIASLMRPSAAMLTDLNRDVLMPVLGPDGQLGHSYLLDISASLSQGIHALADSSMERGFWIEVRGGNGGSKNQFDLADKGTLGNIGSVELFYPTPVLTGPDPNRQRHDRLDVYVHGKLFKNNILRWNQPTPGWRVYLQGETDGGDRLSEIAGKEAPTSANPSARFFEHRFHLWGVDSSGVLVLETMEVTDSNRELLHSLSAWYDRTQSGSQGREYGLFDLSDVRALCSSDDEPWLTWRYAILPQLVEVAVTLGVEELFDPSTRAAWQSANGSPADNSVLEALDEFLSLMGIELRIVGYGLGRTLMVESTE